MCSQSAISDCRSVLLYLFSSKVHVALCGLQVVYPLVESASRYDADQPMSLMTTSAQPAHQQQQYRYDNSCPSNSSSSSVVQQPVDLSRSNTSNNSSSSRLATVSTTSRRQANQSLSTSSSKQRKPAKRSKLSVSSKRANKGQCCFFTVLSSNAAMQKFLRKWENGTSGVKSGADRVPI